MLAVSAICYAAFRHHKADVRQEKREQLSIIADLKVEEITKWREERIAEHHKGRIWAESVGEGLGSKFCVVLPVLGEEK